jgi:hypothetical protein
VGAGMRVGRSRAGGRRWRSRRLRESVDMSARNDGAWSFRSRVSKPWRGSSACHRSHVE